MEAIRQTLVLQKIIIVDDVNRVEIQALKKNLEHHGFAVIPTIDVDSLVDVVKHAKINLLLVNVELEGFKGFQTIRKLRVDPVTRRIPVLAIGTDSSSDKMKMALNLGADDFLAKNDNFVENTTHVIEKYLVHLTARRNLGME